MDMTILSTVQKRRHAWTEHRRPPATLSTKSPSGTPPRYQQPGLAHSAYVGLIAAVRADQQQPRSWCPRPQLLPQCSSSPTTAPAATMYGSLTLNRSRMARATPAMTPVGTSTTAWRVRTTVAPAIAPAAAAVAPFTNALT